MNPAMVHELADGGAFMNKLGIYYAYWTESWDVEFEPYLDRGAALGFELIELNGGTLSSMSSAERRQLRAHADAIGVELSYCVGLPAKYDVASPDAGVRRRGIEFLRRMIDAVREMGGGNLGGILYGSWPSTLPAGVDDRRPYRDRSVDAIRQAATWAADGGVTLSMEVVNRFEQFIMNTAQEGVEFVERVGDPSVTLHLDTFHMNIEERSMDAAIHNAGRHLGHLHVGENNRTAPGRGHLDWEGLGKALRAVHYEGAIVLEPFLRPGGQVGRDIRVYRDLTGGVDLDQEASAGLRFLKRALQLETDFD